MLVSIEGARHAEAGPSPPPYRVRREGKRRGAPSVEAGVTLRGLTRAEALRLSIDLHGLLAGIKAVGHKKALGGEQAEQRVSEGECEHDGRVTRLIDAAENELDATAAIGRASWGNFTP